MDSCARAACVVARLIAARARGEAAQQGTLMWLYVGIAVLVIGGVAIFLYGR